MTEEQYRAHLNERGITDGDEMDALVAMKIAKGDVVSGSSDDILKAATAAVEEVFPELSKATKKVYDKQMEKENDPFLKDEDEDDAEKGGYIKTEKGNEKDLVPGADARGKGAVEMDAAEALSEQASEVAFNQEVSRYGKSAGQEHDIEKSLDEETLDLVAIMSKGADDVVSEVAGKTDALAKSYMTLANVVSSQSKRQDAGLNHLNAKVDALLKAVGQPVPPRSIVDVSEVDVVEAPGQKKLSKGGDITAKDVIALAQDELRKGADTGRASELSMAVAMIESGANPIEIAKSANLSIH